MKAIINKISGLPTKTLEEFKDFQGKLKNTTQEDLEKLKKSMIKRGFISPIFIWNNHILDGHQRIKALKSLKQEEYNIPEQIPYVIITANNKQEAAEMVLAYNSQYGNITQEGLLEFTKDFEINLSCLKEDLSLNIELEDTTCFEEETIEEDDFEPPEDIKTVKTNIVQGNIFILGNHALMCGDATKSEDVGILMGKEKADMILTDPPYNTGMNKKTNCGSTWLNHMFEDSFTDKEWKIFFELSTNNLYSSIKDNAVAYIFMGWKEQHNAFKWLSKQFQISNVIIWDKVVHGLGSDYKYCYEIINVCKKGKPILFTHHDKEYKDIWPVQRTMGKNKDHATAKPLKLLEIPLRHASKKGHVVLDLFGGSGSTLIACEQTGRCCRMMEISPEYCQVIINRWETLTGNKAKKI